MQKRNEAPLSSCCRLVMMQRATFERGTAGTQPPRRQPSRELIAKLVDVLAEAGIPVKGLGRSAGLVDGKLGVVLQIQATAPVVAKALKERIERVVADPAAQAVLEGWPVGVIIVGDNRG